MKRSMTLLMTLIFVVAAAFLVGRFFTQNAEPVQLEFWNWRTKEIQKGYLIALVFLAGIFISGFLTLSTVLSKTFEVSRLKREVLALQRLLDQQSKDQSSSPKIAS